MNILAVYAHPDDAEFLASGSMAKWAEEGHRVHAVCATDGSMGTKIVGRTRAEVAERRRDELTRAMEVIGDFAAHHPPDQLALVHFRGGLRAHRVPVAKHRDSVGQAEDLFQAVRDINNRNSFLF